MIGSRALAAAARFGILCVCLLGARVAVAQTTGAAGTTGTTNLVAADFFISVQRPEGVNISNFDLPRFFNKANCDCDEPVFVYTTLTAQGLGKRSLVSQSANVQVWIGTSCDNVLLQNSNCIKLIDEPLATFFAHGRETFPTTARIMSTFTGSNSGVDGGVAVTTGTFTPNVNCTSPIGIFTQTIWVLVDTNGDRVNDVSPPATTAVQIDLTAPQVPNNTVVSPGNEAVNVSWDKLDTSIETDLAGYQVLCQRGGGLQVFPDNTFEPAYRTCATKPMGTAVAGLDPLYACSPLLNRSSASFRVKILQNAIPYGAAVVAVDNSGNASTPEIHFAVPEKTDSFYDVYRHGDSMTAGGANGGFCAVAVGDARPFAGVCLALAAGAVVLLRRRRRP